jgi:hypothetical protein
MRTSIKAQLLNLLAVTIGGIALIFSFVASWVIMHEMVMIINQMPISSNMIIASSLGVALILLWLNSLLMDSVMWTVGKCWQKGIKSG